MNPRTFILTSDAVASNAALYLRSLPTDGTIEVVYRKHVKKRRDIANSLYWIRLAEIADQAWVAGKQYSAEVWAEFLKEQYLPEAFIEGETLDGYVKWIELPNGKRSMVGSTTKLTVRGFASYLTQIEAYASSELMVQFSCDR